MSADDARRQHRPDASGDRPRYPPSPTDAQRQARKGKPLQPRAPEVRSPRPDPADGAAPPPRYTRYRASGGGLLDDRSAATALQADSRRGGGGEPAQPARKRLPRITLKRLLLGIIALILAWLALSLVLFLISSHFERTPPPANVASVLESAGYPLTSTSNILVLGSDKREKTSKEPGANSGPSRSDTIMLLRVGGGKATTLSIPRDTVVEIPGYGEQKINAAYAIGGPKLAIEVIKRFLGVPINHLVEVNFESFPALINAMGGVTYKGGCVHSRIAGGARNGGYTLWLAPGSHHLDGRQALTLARTRENLCAVNQDDINRAERQQALLKAMKSQLLRPASFLRLPLIAWNTPPTIISDMSGETLLGLFAAMSVASSPPTRVLKPTGTIVLPDGEDGLTVSAAAKRRAVAELMRG